MKILFYHTVLQETYMNRSKFIKDNPAKPVVSMIGTPGYKLAKFLRQITKPYILTHI